VSAKAECTGLCGRTLAASKSLGHGFPISAIVHGTRRWSRKVRGHAGRYSVKLVVDGDRTRSAGAEDGSAVKIPAADLRKQFGMQKGATVGITTGFEALGRIGSRRASR